MLRGALHFMLDAEGDFQVVGEAEDGHAALTLAEELQPDILLIDISMPGPSGIEVTRILKQKLPAIRVLVLTMYDDAATMREAMAAGARGYVPKRMAVDELVKAIRIVAAGGTYWPPRLQDDHIDKANDGYPPSVTSLTQGELDVLHLMVAGYTKGQIVQQLRISMDAVDARMEAVTAVVGFHNRVALVRYAHEHGIV